MGLWCPAVTFHGSGWWFVSSVALGCYKVPGHDFIEPQGCAFQIIPLWAVPFKGIGWNTQHRRIQGLTFLLLHWQIDFNAEEGKRFRYETPLPHSKPSLALSKTADFTDMATFKWETYFQAVWTHYFSCMGLPWGKCKNTGFTETTLKTTTSQHVLWGSAQS